MIKKILCVLMVVSAVYSGLKTDTMKVTGLTAGKLVKVGANKALKDTSVTRVDSCNVANNGITGLTAGYVPKAASATSLSNSNIYDDGTNIGLGITSPAGKLDIRRDGISGLPNLALSNGNVAQWEFRTPNSNNNLYLDVWVPGQRDSVLKITNSAGTHNWSIMGKVGIDTYLPTAVLHLKAGTATAGTGPFKFTAGTNTTNPEAGLMEWDGVNLMISQTSGPTRKTIAYTDGAVTAHGLSNATYHSTSGIPTNYVMKADANGLPDTASIIDYSDSVLFKRRLIIDTCTTVSSFSNQLQFRGKFDKYNIGIVRGITDDGLIFMRNSLDTATMCINQDGVKIGRKMTGSFYPECALDVFGRIMGDSIYTSKIRSKPAGGRVIVGDTFSVIKNVSLFGSGIGNAYFQLGSLNFLYSLNSESNAVGYINWHGYQNGATLYRDFSVCNGKEGNILFVDGSASSVGIGTTEPTSTLHNAGSFSLPISSVKTGNYTATASDYTIRFNVVSNNDTCFLPTSTGIEGRIYVVKDTGRTCANDLIIDPYSTETINGNSTYTVNYCGDAIVEIHSATIQSDGVGWITIGTDTRPADIP